MWQDCRVHSTVQSQCASMYTYAGHSRSHSSQQYRCTRQWQSDRQHRSDRDTPPHNYHQRTLHCNLGMKADRNKHVRSVHTHLEDNSWEGSVSLTLVAYVASVSQVAIASSIDMVTRQVTVDTLTAELTVWSIGAILTRHVTRHSYPPLVTLTHTNRGVAHALRTRRITLADELVECQAV